MGKKRTWFPHFHVHDEHSIKDGCSTVETYADLVVESGGDCLAITNHGQAAGFARQYFACRDRKIKPVFGMEAYVNEWRTRPIKRLQEELKKAEKAAKKSPARLSQIKAKQESLKRFIAERFRPSPHAIILAKNRVGYQNLVRMSTDSYQHGFYYVPRTDTKFLSEHREGLIYSTACIGGYIPRMARVDFAAACEEARRLKAIFEDGGGGFYVELMITEYEAQRETNEVMIRLATEIGAKCILTCDVHYAKPDDGQAQNVLLLMRDKKTIADREAGEGVWQFEAKDLWWRTVQDVVQCWRENHSDYMDRSCFQAALKNTLALADEIEDVEFDTSLKLPGVFKEPDHDLKELVKSGLRYRKEHGQLAPGVKLSEYTDRIKRELSVISPKGFSEYFLILHDVCRAAREMGARMGPGRGSAGGSLTAYLCRITEIDPLRFGLLFERFLDAGRDDPPDIDLDFSPEHRDGIKAYVEKAYPATATIGSNATFKPRATLQDVGRVFGIDYREMQQITKPLGTEADDMTWDEIFEAWPAVERFADDHPEAWSVVRVLRGLISHRGKNAAGMLIAPASALNDVPMIMETDSKGNKMTVTAFADSQGDGVEHKGRELTRLGYLKADLLGVRNLNIAPQAVEIVARDTGQEIDLESLSLDDEETLQTAATGDVPGAFQLDTNTTRPILRHVGVDSFADLVMITALCRPGPLKNQIHREFAKLKRSDAWEDDVLPELRELLRDSRGLMVLQEDVMWVVQVVSGMSMQEANMLRKIMSKKQPEAMKQWKERFVEGGKEVGLATEEELVELWDKIKTFAGYGFNKCVCYNQPITVRRTCGTAKETDRGQEYTNEVRVWGGVPEEEVVGGPQEDVQSTQGDSQTGPAVQPRQGQCTGCEGEGAKDFPDEGLRGNRGPERCSKEECPQAPHAVGAERGWQEGVFRDSQENVSEEGCQAGEGEAHERVGAKQSRSDRSDRSACSGTGHRRSRGAGVSRTSSQSECSQTGSGRGRTGKVRPVRSISSEPKRIDRGGRLRALQSGWTGDDRRLRQGGLGQEQGKRAGVGIDQGTTHQRPQASQGSEDRTLASYQENQTEGGSIRRGLLRQEEEAQEEETIPIGEVAVGDLVLAQDGDWVRVLDVHDHGLQECVEVVLPTGSVVCTWDHRFPTPQGTLTLHKIINTKTRILTKQRLDTISIDTWQLPTSVTPVGVRHTVDLEVDHPTHCYFLANGVCTHNSHATAYMITAYRQLYMLTHHTVEYFAALLTHTPRGKKTAGGGELVVDYMRAAMSRRITLLGPCVVDGAIGFDVDKYGRIRYGLGHVKGVGGAAQLVMAASPFESLEDMFDRIERRRVNSRVFKQLIFSGALDKLDFNRHAGKGDPIPEWIGVERRNGILARYEQLRKAKETPDVFSTSVLREKEREVLGLPLSWWSSDTVQELRDQEGLETIDYHLRSDLSKLEIIAEVSRARTHRTKKGTTMAFLTLADETGTLPNVTIWPEQWSTYRRMLSQGRMAIIRLRRKENHNREFGEWSYYLEDKWSEPVESVARALRRDTEGVESDDE